MEELSRSPAASAPRRRTPWTHLALLSLLAWPATSNAGLITSNGGASESGLGSYIGSIGVSNNTATTATITVALTNISPAPNGGFITAFAFNNPGTAGGGDILNVADFSATDPDGGGSGVAFALLGGPASSDSINASPYGSFDIGASLPGGSFQGGGSPAQGIGVGESATFTFDVTGTDLLNLSQASLEAALASGSGGIDSFFIVRFRGFADGGSDKVPAASPVPEPSTLALGGIGLGIGGLGYVRRRRQRVAS